VRDEYKAIGSYGTLGLEIVLAMLVGYFGGHWLDGKLGTDPYLSILGFCFGIGAAVKALARSIKQMNRVAEREEREQGNPRPRFDKPDAKDDDAKKDRHDERP
jgi:ATP synthase protein I